LSLLFAALCFSVPELARLSRFGNGCPDRAPCWTQLLLALVSGAAGAVHVVGIWLATWRMQQHRARPWAFTSLYEVALLSRAEVALTATLLLLSMLKVAGQLRFVRRWAVFGKTFRAVGGELLGSGLLLTLLLLALTHSMCLVSSLTLPSLRTPCSALLALLRPQREGPSLGTVLQVSPLLGCCLLVGVALLGACRGLLCASVLSGHRGVRTEMYRQTPEPKDHEMVEFLVKRFKLWLGLSKAKEYRHTVRFEGLDSARPGSATNSRPSRPPSAAFLPPSSRPPPGSPRPELPSGLAVERLPVVVADLLDRLERVTLVLGEVGALEYRLQLWHTTLSARGAPHREAPHSPAAKQPPLPRTYSTFSESALTRLRLKVTTWESGGLTRRPPPYSADPLRWARLLGHPGSAGVCQRVRQMAGAVRRPHSEERSGGSQRSNAPQTPVPPKRRAWDPEKPGDM
ncbi:hypothetical protein FKM82_022461, partial [Ascaphus truei]